MSELAFDSTVTLGAIRICVNHFGGYGIVESDDSIERSIL